MENCRLSVAVAGGGIGGLTAAIALRRAGHEVPVYERSSFDNETGAAVTTSPLGGRVLRHIGIDSRQAGITAFPKTDILHGQTLEQLGPSLDHANYNELYGADFGSANRPDLHHELSRIASRMEGGGKPVKLEPGSKVRDFDAEAGCILFQDGSAVTTDLVIAADGVHSVAGIAINGSDCPPLQDTGTIVYRFTIPTKKILDDPETKELLSAGPGVGTFYVNAKAAKWIVRYYCRDNEVCNFAVFAIRSEEQADIMQIRYEADRASLEKEMREFHPTLRKVATMASDVLPLWRVATRDPLPHLQRGQLVVIGDAAHPMCPHLGLGANTAIEDAGALGALFDIHSLSSNDNLQAQVRKRLKIFEQLRKPRVAAYKCLSDVPIWRDTVEENREILPRYMQLEDMPANRSKLMPWLLSYEVLKHAEQLLQQNLN